MLGIAAICFSYSDKIKDSLLSDRLIFAAERLIHGSILVLMSSILRYFAGVLLGENSIKSLVYYLKIPFMTLVIIGAVVFSNGILFAQKGLLILSDILNDRMFRYSDWDE